MRYPIWQGGIRAGELTVRREGLYTVFEARLPPSRDLTRLWVAGGGRSACLGLMEPGEEGLRLCRRLSTAAQRDFPEPLEYACTEPPAEPGGEEAEPEREEPAGEAEEGLLWFAGPDGSLSAYDGRGRLLALPAALRRVPPGARLARIQGREYLVFRS